jgi:DNA repair protein RadC
MNAYAIAIMHNHPSGDATPSQADIRVTKNLREAAGMLQISLIDHIIVGSSHTETPFFSFKEAGLI